MKQSAERRPWPWADIGLGLGALGVYLFTLAPGLLPADSGEYQVTGALFGVAHPPGFPAYTLLSGLVARLLAPLPAATAINAFSAGLAAATLVAVSRAVRTWTGATAAGLLAALTLGAAATFWAQATTTNIRMFTAFAVALALAGLADYSRNPRNGRALALGAFGLGLAVAHHGSTAFLAAVLGLYALAVYALGDWSPVRLALAGGLTWRGALVVAARQLWPALAGLLPFLSWGYFLVQVRAFGALKNAGTWEGFLDQVFARDALGAVLAFATPELLPDRVRVLGVILAFQWHWSVLALGAVGALVLAAGPAELRDRLLAAALGLAFVIHTFFAITYAAPQTAEYLLPGFVLLAVPVGVAGAAALRWARTRPAVGLPLLAVAVLGAGVQVVSTYPAYRELAQDDSTRAFAEAVLAEAPPNAVVLAPWHWVTPLWYLHHVEGRRPDVEVRYVVPRGRSYAENWVEDIQTHLTARPVVVTSFFKPEYAASGLRFRPLATPGFPAWEAGAAPLVATPAGVRGEQAFAAVTLLGQQRVPGLPGALDVIVAWRVAGAPRAVSFFVQLIGPDGQLYGQHDVAVPAARYTAGEVLLERYSVIALPEAPPGLYALTAGAYTPDGARLATAVLGEVTLAPRPAPPVTAHPQQRPGASPELTGYDVDRSLPDSLRVYAHWRLGPRAVEAPWLGTTVAVPAGAGYATTPLELPLDANWPGAPGPEARYVPLGTELVLVAARLGPASAAPGEAVTAEVTFLAARPIVRDLVVKLDLVGAGWHAQLDTVPVGGGLPTLKWITGRSITDRLTVTVPPEAAAGPAQLVLGWYDAFNQRDLPLLDPRLAQLGPTVPLGAITITP